MHGGIGSGQTINDGLHDQQPTSGRTQGILQSDNEDTLNAPLKATASKVGSMTVRHSPSYSSNSQGSVERLHRTRVVKARVESNYSVTMSTKHCLLPWIVRHAAWTVNRYVIHPDGYTSFERRWGRNYERAICEFGQTLLYLPPQHKKLPEADLRMQKCIWLGKVSETGENYVATESGIQNVRTVRRLQPDFKYDLTKFPAHHGHHDGTPTTHRSQHCWIRNYNRQRKEGPRKISDNKRTLLTTSLRNPQQNNNALHHLHDFRQHRRQVHDHYRVVRWLLHQPDDIIHHYQHHLDKHYDV